MTRLSNFHLFLFISCLLLSGCKRDNPPATCGPDYEADPPGQWYFGDFHVHATGASNDTGGDSYPADIKQIAKQRGLDFVVLTDHSNSTGSDPTTSAEDPALFNLGPEFPYWDEAATLSDASFKMIDGNEISPRSLDSNPNLPTGHIGCLPMDLNTFDPNIAFIDRPRETVNGAQTIQQAKDAGCFAILNHPYGIFKWVTYDWTSYDYDAIEIWNGTLGFDQYDQFAHDAWVCDLLAGRDKVAVGGSDCHRVFTDPPGSTFDPSLGYPTTAVFATSLDWPSIMIGLQAGKTAIFEGDSRLFIDGYDASLCLKESTETKFIRLRGTFDATQPNGNVILKRSTSCNDPRPDHLTTPELTSEELLNQPITGGESFDIQVEIDGEPGVYTASVGAGPTETHYWALSRAIVIR